MQCRSALQIKTNNLQFNNKNKHKVSLSSKYDLQNPFVISQNYIDKNLVVLSYLVNVNLYSKNETELS